MMFSRGTTGLLWGLVLFFFTVCVANAAPSVDNASVDLIIFSYDRPMQLYAYLESCEKHLQHVGSIFILYRTSTDAFDDGYRIVQQRFPSVTFMQQTRHNSGDFKPLLLHLCFKASTAEYVMFGVDDIIVTRNVDLLSCVKSLQQTKDYGFYLRLGKNIITHYGLKDGEVVLQPALSEVMPTIFEWAFADNDFFNPWHYPHSVDMTIFKKTTIENALHSLAYASPNSLECLWSRAVKLPPASKGLCFDVSCMVNIPLNVVQEDYQSEHMNFASKDICLAMLQFGFKVDVDRFYGYQNRSPHENLEPALVARK